MTDFRNTRYLCDLPEVQEVINRAESAGKITAKYEERSLYCKGDMIRFYDDIPDDQGECEEVAYIFYNPENEVFEYSDFGHQLITRSRDLRRVILALKKEAFRNYDFEMTCAADDAGEITCISCEVTIRGGVPSIGSIKRSVRKEGGEEVRADTISPEEAVRFIDATGRKRNDTRRSVRNIRMVNCGLFREIVSGTFDVREWFDEDAAKDEYRPGASRNALAPCGVADPCAALAYDKVLVSMDIVNQEAGKDAGDDAGRARAYIRSRGASPETFSIIYRDFFGMKTRHFRMQE